MTATITKAPEHWPIASTRCYFRGHLMDYETAAVIMAAEAELGYELTVVQGCYNVGGVAASAGTHDGGGAFDLEPFDFARKVKVLRSLGCASWHREAIPGVWEEHVHSIVRNHPTLSPAAVEQQRYFDMKPRHNGLAGEPVDPDQYPGRPTPTFHYPPKAPVLPTFQGAGLNDDWGNKASDVASVVGQVRPLIMGVQEGWRVEYKTVVPSRWRVHQRLEDDSTAGVAVISDTRRLQHIGRSHDPADIGHGWQAIGKGSDTRMRGVAWDDQEFRAGVNRGDLPERFRPASVHRPPMRNRSDWDDFDAVLGLWLRRSPLPVALFMDSNEHDGPHPLLDDVHSGYGWHAVPKSIDGCLTDLTVKGVKQLPKETSDHHPIVVTFG